MRGKPSVPGLAGRFRRAPSTARRRQAVTMAEGILYMIVSLLVIVFAVRILDAEADRQSRILVAGDLQQSMQAAQLFVATQYDVLRDDLFRDTLADEPMITAIPMTDTPFAGFFAPTFDPDDTQFHRLYGQDIVMLVRSVLRGDPGSPQVTVTPDEVRDPTTGNILSELIDGDFAVDDTGVVTNDELDLEAILVTVGGSTDPFVFSARDGYRIISLSEVPSAGFTAVDSSGTSPALVARGPLGGWELDITRFATDGNAVDIPNSLRPTAGRFASVIALSRFGVLTPAGLPAEEDDTAELLRCSGPPRGSAAYEACIAPGQTALMAHLVFNDFDADGDGLAEFASLENVGIISMADVESVRDEDSGVIDIADIPRIEGVTFLYMREPFASSEDPDAPITHFPVITDVARIVMAPPIDIDPGVDVDISYAEITKLGGVSCRDGGSTRLADGTLVFDCDSTQLSNRLTLDGSGGDASFDMAGPSKFHSDVSAGRVLVRDDAAASSGFALVSDAAILISDTTTQSWIDPTVVRAGRIEAESGRANTLRVVAGNDVFDATEGGMQSFETRTVASEGQQVGFARPNCPSGLVPFFRLAAVEPPPGKTVNGVSVALPDTAPADGWPDKVLATVTFNTNTDDSDDVACTRACVSYYSGSFTPIHDDCVIVDCPASVLWKAPSIEVNPKDTVITALIGCE